VGVQVPAEMDQLGFVTGEKAVQIEVHGWSFRRRWADMAVSGPALARVVHRVCRQRRRGRRGHDCLHDRHTGAAP
jgi:hypothetical protein